MPLKTSLCISGGCSLVAGRLFIFSFFKFLIKSIAQHSFVLVFQKEYLKLLCIKFSS